MKIFSLEIFHKPKKQRLKGKNGDISGTVPRHGLSIDIMLPLGTKRIQDIVMVAMEKMNGGHLVRNKQYKISIRVILIL